MTTYKRPGSSMPLYKSLNCLEPKERAEHIERMTWMLHMHNRSLIILVRLATDQKQRAKRVKQLKENARQLRALREYVPQEWSRTTN